MDPRISLIKEYYCDLPRDRAKVETRVFGFGLLDRLASDGIVLEYGELTLSGLLHKYKLANIPQHAFDPLLESHVGGHCNVCLYFDDRANSVFCLNLDNNHKTDNTALIPEMEIAVQAVRETLGQVGCEPLVVASGRGYHIWGLVERPVPNADLYEFMMRTSVLTMARIRDDGRDHLRVKFNVYPDPRTRDTVSLRLFGTRHAKNGTFSRVLTVGGVLLDEDASWAAFESHLRDGTLTTSGFGRACEALVRSAPFPLPVPGKP